MSLNRTELMYITVMLLHAPGFMLEFVVIISAFFV